VLDFLGRTTLHYGDVTLVSDGSCRLHPQLAQRQRRNAHIQRN
jgi:hypothetical protein